MEKVLQVEPEAELLRQFLRYEYFYNKNINICHSISTIMGSNPDAALGDILDAQFLETLLSQMTFTSIKDAIGKFLCNENNITYTYIADVYFDFKTELMYVVYGE